MSSRVDSEAIARARAVPIINEITRRGIKLRRQGRELVGPCPVCGGRDRFQVHTVKNTWLCRRCPAGGSIIDLVQHLDDVPFAEAVSRLTGGARPAPTPRRAPAPKPGPSQEDWQRRALDLWDQAAPIAGTIAEQYLRAPKLHGGRAINLSDLLPPDLSPRVLRFHPRCPFDKGAQHPCLLALYRSLITDEPTGIMRTALTLDARKIDRKAMGQVGGAAIKITPDEDVAMALTIGEGLETTLAGIVKGFAPAWALGSDGGIRKFPLLAGIEALTILGETDDGGANERAVRECAGRWLAAGREVYRATSLIGGDMNDGLMHVA